jgi:hypothetical protein
MEKAVCLKNFLQEMKQKPLLHGLQGKMNNLKTRVETPL